jgi:hypothetical protein
VSVSVPQSGRWTLDETSYWASTFSLYAPAKVRRLVRAGIKQLKRTGRGYRNAEHYKARILLRQCLGVERGARRHPCDDVTPRPHGRFILAHDRVPVAVTGPHGHSLAWLP